MKNSLSSKHQCKESKSVVDDDDDDDCEKSSFVCEERN